MELNGKNVLITGASAGIGAATTLAMAARGATVMPVARSEDKLASLAEQIGDRCHPYACDVGDHEAVAEMAAKVTAERGVPNVIVNNAGIGRWLFIEETDPAEFEQMTAVPYMAAFFVTRAFVHGMLARRSGWVVNVNTPAAWFPFPGAMGYSGSRWGVRGFTTTLRADLRGTGIGVSQVIPGKVSSDYFANNPGAEDRIPKMDRLVKTLTPEQVGETICDAVVHERRDVFEPFLLRLFVLQARFFPRSTEWLMWKTGARRD